MQAFARAPTELSNKGPMDKNWKIFKEQFLTFMKVTEGNLEASDKQAIMLLNLMGKVGQEALQNIPFQYPEEKENIQILLEKFDKYFDPPKRETSERYAFFQRTRKPNESIEDFIADLREKAKTCNFDFLADSLVRDKVILDTKDKLLRKLLIDTDDLDLTKVVTIYKSHEMATEKMKQIYKEKTKQTKDTTVAPSTTTPEVENIVKNCSRCGIQHTYRNCPAWGKKCLKCQGLGHYTHKCTPQLAQKSNRSNFQKEPNKNSVSPFTQIDKKTKRSNQRRTFSSQRDTYLSDDQILPLMSPPVYTPYPTATEAYNPGYMHKPANLPAYSAQSGGATNCSDAFERSQSTIKKAPLQTCSMQCTSSSYSGAGSAPPLDSNNVSVTKNTRNGSLYPDLPHSTSSSNVKSTTMNSRSNSATPLYGEDVVNSTAINQERSPGCPTQRNVSKVIDPSSLIEDFVTIRVRPMSPERPSSPPPRQRARTTIGRPQTSSTQFSNISTGSKSKKFQSNESDKCVIS